MIRTQVHGYLWFPQDSSSKGQNVTCRYGKHSGFPMKSMDLGLKKVIWLILDHIIQSYLGAHYHKNCSARQENLSVL
jgi:hypothetical protein